MSGLSVLNNHCAKSSRLGLLPVFRECSTEKVAGCTSAPAEEVALHVDVCFAFVGLLGNHGGVGAGIFRGTLGMFGDLGAEGLGLFIESTTKPVADGLGLCLIAFADGCGEGGDDIAWHAVESRG